MKRRYALVDVFADRPLAGNPLAVFPDAKSIPEELLQPIAREMDHAATAFLSPSSQPGAQFRLRIFSREHEIPFAGHPALGAHFVHATESRLPLQEPVTRVAHEGNQGLFQVEILVENGRIGMLRLEQRPPEMSRRLAPEEVGRVARALGLSEEDIQATNQPVKVASTGLPVLIVPISTLQALGAVRPRYGDLLDLLEGRDATIVYAFTKETRDAHSAAHARAFDTVGASEIPGAGAAAGALSAYLVAHSAVAVKPVTELVVEQGHALGRPSTLYVEVHVDEAGTKGERRTTKGAERETGDFGRPRIRQVILGGRVVPIGEGWLDV
ncbi:MAG TPA: PhzF family phenazine biosynthesis protein [Thermoanaerobaculia bacterium]|nr:PhzF family phenazine biosynthesis protein [Thermoanaerobaculia bacterium]